jgi:hypothetical protein
MRLTHLALPAAALLIAGAAHPAAARTIVWPDGCAYAAHNPNEHPLPNACAEAIDALDWSMLSRGDDGEAACDPDYSHGLRRVPELSEDGPHYIRFQPLARGRFVVSILCRSGAYNATYIYVLYDETRRPARAQFLWFPVYRMRDGVPVKEIVPYLFARTFNPATRELVALAKYRGMGDCGEFSRYVLRGSTPVLMEFRAKTDCDGTAIYRLRRGLAQPSPHWKRYFPP